MRLGVGEHEKGFGVWGLASAFLLLKEDLKAHNLLTYFETIEVRTRPKFLKS